MTKNVFIDTIEKMLKVYEKKNEQDFIIKKIY